MAQDLVLAAGLIGVCIDCGSPTRPRTNWQAIAPAHRAQQSSFFHRCPRCYVLRQLDAAGGGETRQASAAGRLCELRRRNGQGRGGARVQPATALARSRACARLSVVCQRMGDVAGGVSGDGVSRLP